MTFIIGIMGARGSGKTSVAQYLQNEMGFYSVHPFAGGKDMITTYFMRCGLAPLASSQLLHDPELKLKPFKEIPALCHLPYTNAVDMMETWGKFMFEQSVELTLGTELKRAAQFDKHKVVIESVAYETEYIREKGGFLIYLERPYNKREPGKHTDAVDRRHLCHQIVDNNKDKTHLFNTVHMIVTEQLIKRGLYASA